MPAVRVVKAYLIHEGDHPLGFHDADLLTL